MEITVLIGLLFAAFAVITLNIVVLHRTNQRLEAQTQVVTRLAIAQRDLELRLDRLANAIDQSRQQLYRALELSSNVHRIIYGTLHKAAGVTPDDISTINTYLIELKAIAVVNGDTGFIERVGKLRDSVDFLLTLNPDDLTPTLPVSKATEEVQRKVYDLLAAATRVSEGT